MRLVQEAEIKGRTVLLLVDYNVAINSNKISSTFKIDQTLKTIDFIQKQNPSLLFISTHLGRPASREECDVFPIFEYLTSLFSEIKFLKINEFSGIEKGLLFGDNSRYYSSLVDFYNKFDVVINDAFGCAHRKGSPRGYAGCLMQREIEVLNSIEKCDLLIIGGAKGKEKIKITKRFNSNIMLTGLLAVEFMRGLKHEGGIKVGSVHEMGVGTDFIENTNFYAREGMYLPEDFIVITEKNEYKKRDLHEIERTDKIVDIGEKTVNLIGKLIEKSKLIFWNGPVGKFEDEHAESTRKIVKMLGEAKGKVVIGGGETLTAVNEYSNNNKFYFVSTGGGAMLSYLGGEKMPGIESLK